MQVRRFVFASLLFTGCCLLPGTWAPAGGRASAQDEKPATKADLEETDKTVAALKKALEKTQKDLEATKKALDAVKTPGAGDDSKALAKKIEALQKDVEAATKAAATAKTDLAAVTTKSATLEAELAKVKAAGGDVKATTEKVAAMEKAAEESKKGADKAAEESKKAADELKKTADKGVTDAGAATSEGKARGDTAWLLTSSALVLLMVPGLALFYGGMVRRKNVLGTMMHSMAALAVVGVYWIAIGYSLAFGPSVIKIDMFGVDRRRAVRLELGSRVPEGDRAVHKTRRVRHPGLPARHVPGDVRDHHPGAHQRGDRRAHPVLAVLPVHDPVGDVRVLPAGAHGVGVGLVRRQPAAREARRLPPSGCWARWARSTSPAARWFTSPRAWPVWRAVWCSASGTATRSRSRTRTAWC